MHSLGIIATLITTQVVSTFVGVAIGYWLLKDRRVEDWWTEWDN